MKKLIMLTILLIGYCFTPVSAQAEKENDSTGNTELDSLTDRKLDEFAEKINDFFRIRKDLGLALNVDPTLLFLGDEEHGYEKWTLDFFASLEARFWRRPHYYFSGGVVVEYATLKSAFWRFGPYIEANLVFWRLEGSASIHFGWISHYGVPSGNLGFGLTAIANSLTYQFPDSNWGIGITQVFMRRPDLEENKYFHYNGYISLYYQFDWPGSREKKHTKKISQKKYSSEVDTLYSRELKPSKQTDSLDLDAYTLKLQ